MIFLDNFKMKIFYNLFLYLSYLDKKVRRLIILTLDAFLLYISSLLSFKIVYSSFSLIDYSIKIKVFALIPIIGVIIYAICGQYKSLTRYLSGYYLYKFIIRNFIFIISSFLISKTLDQNFNLMFWILLFFLSATSTGLLRLLVKDLIRFISKGNNDKNLKNIVIYGAGNAGYQLATSLKLSSAPYKILFFVDDDNSLWDRILSGMRIYSPKRLIEFKKVIDQIFLAIPSLGPKKRMEIFNKLKGQGHEILIIPSIDEIANGKAKIDLVRPIVIEDLLSRNSVSSDPRLLGPGISDKSICVTGAGGSIGSEICRQLVFFKPKRIVLIELCEHKLYEINKELEKNNGKNIQIIPILGNVSNYKFMELTLKKYEVQIIYHSAAYKHVPLVETNPIEGILNNILTTKTVCEIAENLRINEIILLSSDKAVRPTSVMGVTKRISELIFQAFAEKVQQDVNPLIKYSMVRFGNVLGSSGSVVPLFNEQIANGGPISITHPEVTRYFMTITEAAQLVLQAAVLSKGGDLFLLDMGEPIKIVNLAEQMISLSGKTLNNNNFDGGIDIVYTGLRPGEKLYEELLIDAKSEPTMHPLIFKAKEKSIPYIELMPKVEKLKKNLFRANIEQVFSIMSELVPEWERKK